mgnify:CR=1 FL=1
MGSIFLFKILIVKNILCLLKVILHTLFQELQIGFTIGKKDWKIKSGEYRANTSLWKELDRLNILVNPEWVKIARNSTFLHDLADHLANHLALSQICMPAKQIQSLLQKCKI